MTAENKQLRLDRMRFIKNKLPANLALLAILFDVLYFVSVYRSDVRDYYYTILIGASILYNLVFMLACFLSSEGIKNYKGRYALLLLALGAGQFVRIFILPARAHGTVLKKVDDTEQLLTCDSDLAEASSLRKKIPYLATRRPECYL